MDSAKVGTFWSTLKEIHIAFASQSISHCSTKGSNDDIFRGALKLFVLFAAKQDDFSQWPSAVPSKLRIQEITQLKLARDYFSDKEG